MSAQELRKAASLMREEARRVCRPYARQELVAEAVADWLEVTADEFVSDLARTLADYGAAMDQEDYEAGYFTRHPALAVARAYLEADQ